MNARPAWLAVVSIPFRACQICDHGVTVNQQRYCRRKVVVQPASTAPVHAARAKASPCGPDALFLEFPGMRA